MKIYQNKPKNNWISPYAVKEKFFFWKKDYDAHKNKPPVWLQKACECWLKTANFFNRDISYVKIDYWDTWSMDHTLSPIILPMLKQLKATKHGSPVVEDCDVPEHLQYEKQTKRRKTKSKIAFHDTHRIDDDDTLIHRRWDYVMDEMIWAFEQLCDDNSEDQFWKEHGEIDWDAEPNEDGSIPVVWKKKAEVDWDGLKAHNERIDRGLALFGKYFRALWD